MDEPTTGLDPRGRAGLWQIVNGLTAQGSTVLLTTQYLEEADQLADAIVVIDSGRVIAAGTADQLKARVGGDRLELRATPGTDPAALAAVVADLGSGPPTVDADSGTVLLPVADGPRVLAQALARVAAAELRPDRRRVAASVARRRIPRPDRSADHHPTTGPAAGVGTSVASAEAGTDMPRRWISR